MEKIVLGILSWNHYKLIERCVTSIKEHTDLSGIRFVIFNNGSTDPTTLDWLSKCGEEVITFDKNYGISGGSRMAFEWALKEGITYMCIANCDILVTDDWFCRMLEVIRGDGNIIVVTPKDNNSYLPYQYFPVPVDVQPELMSDGEDVDTRYFGEDIKLQEYVKKEFYEKRKRLVYVGVTGIDFPAPLWNVSLVNKVGNFNEAFDYALSEQDFTLRAREAGYALVICLTSFIYHAAHGQAGKYSGFEKLFKGKHLNTYVDEKAAQIKGLRSFDLANYGDTANALSPRYTSHETELVKLE